MSDFTLEQQGLLLLAARESIIYGCRHGTYLPTETLAIEHPELQAIASTFITLKAPNKAKVLELRGCMGSVEASNPVFLDVVHHAYAAAFKDPRFPGVQSELIPLLHIAISVISPQETLQFANEKELLDQLRPGIDGLIIQTQHQCATFLPSVWQHLPDKHLFLRHLKEKAGLAPHFWSDDIKACRYQTQYFEDSVETTSTFSKWDE